VRSCLAWRFASSGDEIYEHARAHARHAFPETQGFIAHRVMMATLDDPTVEELLKSKAIQDA